MGRPVGQKGINIPPKMHLLFLILNVIKKEKRNIDLFFRFLYTGHIK